MTRSYPDHQLIDQIPYDQYYSIISRIPTSGPELRPTADDLFSILPTSSVRGTMALGKNGDDADDDDDI